MSVCRLSEVYIALLKSGCKFIWPILLALLPDGYSCPRPVPGRGLLLLCLEWGGHCTFRGWVGWIVWIMESMHEQGVELLHNKAVGVVSRTNA